MESLGTRQSTEHRQMRRPRALLVGSCLSVLGLAGGSVALGFWQAPAASTRSGPAAVDYRRTERKYESVKLVDTRYGDVTVSVEKQLKADAPAVAKRALARLKAKRALALAAVPKSARERLAKVPFFLMYGPKAREGGKGSGLDYIQKNAPEFHEELDLRWGDSVVIYCAQNYLEISDLWALKALFHELAHAYHLEQWPEKAPDILHAWEHAKENDLYLNVRDVETRKTLPTAYALTNQLEFFAELSCMYFVKCNYEPSDRNKLKAYDPVGYAMIRKMWKVE
jgi:hypothetical protein